MSSSKQATPGGVVTLNPDIKRAIQCISRQSETAVETIKNSPPGIPTGFEKLDSWLYGFGNSQFIILAARPSMGKSSLMLEWALSTARAGYKTVVISLEMDQQSIMERIVCNLSGVALNTIRSGTEDAVEKLALEDVKEEIKKLKLWTVCKPGITCNGIDQVLTAFSQNNLPVDIVFVDYLQIIKSDIFRNKRYDEITQISQNLMELCGKHNVPLVALSQLNRCLEGRDFRRPRLSDLRESGALEQDSHKVLLLHREDYYKEREGKKSEIDGEADLIVAKNRQGPCGEVPLTWIPEVFRFREDNYRLTQYSKSKAEQS